jgi:hypothetical protein
MRARHTAPAALLTLVTLLAASPLEAAPGVFATEASPSPIPAASIINAGAPESAFRVDGAVGVLQPFGPNNAVVSVPICVSHDGVGHAYAFKNGSTFGAKCRESDGGATLNDPQLLKPTGTQLSSVYWVPMRKGGALPRSAAAAVTTANGLPVFACKAKPSTIEQVGVLLPDGSCRLAPYLGGAGARVVDDSSILIRGGSRGADSSPSIGWVYLKPGGHSPGGTLVKWTEGGTFCQARLGGALLPGTLETNTDGSTKACNVVIPGNTFTTQNSSTDIAVFRNDATSGVAFEQSVPASVPRLSIGGQVPCVIKQKLHAREYHYGFKVGERCMTPTYNQSPGQVVQSFELVRRGPWPAQG